MTRLEIFPCRYFTGTGSDARLLHQLFQYTLFFQEMDEALRTTAGTGKGGQIDKAEMDKAVKTTIITGTGGQIDKTENRPRQHQAESHGSGPSRSVSDTADDISP